MEQTFDEDEIVSYDGENCYNKNIDGEYVCISCGKLFVKKDKMRRHWEEVHSGIKYPCDQCSYTSKRKDKLKSHIQNKHPVQEQV